MDEGNQGIERSIQDGKEDSCVAFEEFLECSKCKVSRLFNQSVKPQSKLIICLIPFVSMSAIEVQSVKLRGLSLNMLNFFLANSKESSPIYSFVILGDSIMNLTKSWAKSCFLVLTSAVVIASSIT